MGPWVNQVIDAPDGKLDQYYKEDICDFWDSTNFYMNVNDDATTTMPLETTAITTTSYETIATTADDTAIVTTTGGAVSHHLSVLLLVCALITKFLVPVC